MKKITYDTNKYDFKAIIQGWFNTYDIEHLHTLKDYAHFNREQDQSTMWHTLYYDMIRKDPMFDEIYLNFLKDVIKPRFVNDSNKTIVYQKIPSLRIHLPGNVAVGEFHKDKYYRNIKWAEKVNEISYYLPLTNAYNTNTLWAETREDKGDYRPFNAIYGETIEWDSSNLMHGNKDNVENDTRVSIDFRIIPKSRYINSDHLAINTKIPFGIGEYYEEI